jgi:hypothetical protein
MIALRSDASGSNAAFAGTPAKVKSLAKQGTRAQRNLVVEARTINSAVVSCVVRAE